MRKQLTKKQQELLEAIKNGNCVLSPIKGNETSFYDYTTYTKYQWRTVRPLIINHNIIKMVDCDDFKMPLGTMFGESVSSLELK